MEITTQIFFIFKIGQCMLELNLLIKHLHMQNHQKVLFPAKELLGVACSQYTKICKLGPICVDKM